MQPTLETLGTVGQIGWQFMNCKQLTLNPNSEICTTTHRIPKLTDTRTDSTTGWGHRSSTEAEMAVFAETEGRPRSLSLSRHHAAHRRFLVFNEVPTYVNDDFMDDSGKRERRRVLCRDLGAGVATTFQAL